jgi:hypothetical protein
MDVDRGRFLDKKSKKGEEHGQYLRSDWTFVNWGSLGMILTTHAVVGAAIASFVPSHPVTAFALGFASTSERN